MSAPPSPAPPSPAPLSPVPPAARVASPDGETVPVRPPVAGSASAVLAGAMVVAARLRRGAALHDVGTVYRARLVVTAPDGFGPAPLDRPGDVPVTVRLSRGLGLPPGLPDVVGLGLRLDTPDGPQDLLLDSCRSGPLGRHTPVLRRDVCGGPLGTLVQHRVGAAWAHVGAFPVPGPPVHRPDQAVGTRFELALASPRGPWRRVATVTVDEPAADQTVRLTPTHAALGVRSNAWWLGLRAHSYTASRVADPVTPVDRGPGA